MKSYSEEQYSMMFRLRSGVSWVWHSDANADAILHFLCDEGLAEPHCEITDSWYTLSQLGIAALSRYEQMCDQHADEYAQKRAEDAQRVKDKQQSRKHDFAVAAFSVALTLFLEHIVNIIDFIESLF